jgi:hypothetical protein
MSAEEVAPLIHKKSAIVPSFRSNEAMDSLDITRQLVVHSYTAICRNLQSNSPTKYLPEYSIPQIVKERLSELHLARLICDFRNYIEEKFGRDSPKPRALLKLPAKLFHDVSIDGPQHVILLFLIRSYTDRNLLFPAQYDLLKESPKEMLKLLRALDSFLLENDLMPKRPVVFFNKVPVKSLNKLFRIVTDHGGKIVNSIEAATHVIEWNEEVDTMPEILTDDFIRILEKKTALSNDNNGDDPWFINREDQLALVHWWYHPDCYNEWISTAEIDSTDPPDVSSYWMTSTGRRGETEGDGERILRKWAPLSCRFITDCELFNEWGNEFDYEITASTSDPTSWVVADYVRPANLTSQLACALAPPAQVKYEGKALKDEHDGTSASGRKTRGRKRSVGGSAAGSASEQIMQYYAQMLLPEVPVKEAVPATDKVLIDVMPPSLRPDGVIGSTYGSSNVNEAYVPGGAPFKAARVTIYDLPLLVEDKGLGPGAIGFIGAVGGIGGMGAMEMVDLASDASAGPLGMMKKLEVRGSWTEVTEPVTVSAAEFKEPTPSSSAPLSSSAAAPLSSSSVAPSSSSSSSSSSASSSSSSSSSSASSSSAVAPSQVVPIVNPKAEPQSTDTTTAPAMPSVPPFFVEWLNEASISGVELQYLGSQLSLEDPIPAFEYKRVRNAILDLHKDSERIYLSATECRRKITGDVSVILTAHKFLDAFSVINRSPFLPAFSRPPDLMVTGTAPVVMGQYLMGEPFVMVVTPKLGEEGTTSAPAAETGGCWDSELDARLLEMVAFEGSSGFSSSHPGTLSEERGEGEGEGEMDTEEGFPASTLAASACDWSKIAAVLSQGRELSSSDNTAMAITPAACLARFVEMPIASSGAPSSSSSLGSGTGSGSGSSKVSSTLVSFVVLDRLAELQRSTAALVSCMSKVEGSNEGNEGGEGGERGASAAMQCVQDAVSSFVTTRLEEERLASERRLQGMIKDYMEARVQVLQHRACVLQGVEALLDTEKERIINDSREFQVKKAQLAHYQQNGTGMS